MHLDIDVTPENVYAHIKELCKDGIITNVIFDTPHVGGIVFDESGTIHREFSNVYQCSMDHDIECAKKFQEQDKHLGYMIVTVPRNGDFKKCIELFHDCVVSGDVCLILSCDVEDLDVESVGRACDFLDETAGVICNGSMQGVAIPSLFDAFGNVHKGNVIDMLIEIDVLLGTLILFHLRNGFLCVVYGFVKK
jgi:hypothetical protein